MIVASFVAFAILVAAWLLLPAPSADVEISTGFADMGSEEVALA
jgi:hypothetical protein